MPRYDTSLWARLKSDKTEIEDIPTKLKMFECIVQALSDLQEENLCHLDVKPSNILINLKDGKWNGDLVLTDFGISGTVDSATGRKGTPGCGSPEQFVGKIHQKSDMFALGKLAVLLLFPWNKAWDLLARPKDADSREFSDYPIIAKLLSVSFQKKFWK